jgi:SAM-dependent methyltransferase
MLRSTCSACQGTLRRHLTAVGDPRTREEFAIDVCSGCGLAQTVPQPDQLAPYYGQEYYGNRHAFTASYCARRRLRFVRRATGGAANRSLLDVGCGDGAFLLAAKQKGWNVIGTEMQPQMARNSGLRVFEVLEETAALGPFDCVTLWHSLEHLKDPLQSLKTIRSLLSPKGTVLIAVPDFGGFQARLFGRRWFHLDVPRHLYHFSKEALVSTLRLAGLEVTRTWHQEIELELMGWAQSALNSIMPAPNVFFERLRGARRRVAGRELALNFVLGTALVGLALPATLISTLFARGGTLIVAARPA